MLNMNFSRSVAIDTSSVDWQASPLPGVWRKPLEREAAESGHVTSIVRYDPHSHFSQHFHPQGEEILVLDGVFSDEQGDYPAGTYLRNPPGSHHTPFSQPGCLLFVKLNQIHQDDTQSVRQFTQLDASDAPVVLHQHHSEQVGLVSLDMFQSLPVFESFTHVELLLLSGTIKFKGQALQPLSWLRIVGQDAEQFEICKPCNIWFKARNQT
ncbi:cupin domain-containing protein [Vibrio sp. WXL103]|uniref:cupin domain-containing protein n=1 Tax=unclassified Vibrio TaxID=2614977 RepID=UPI003EC72D76